MNALLAGIDIEDRLLLLCYQEYRLSGVAKLLRLGMQSLSGSSKNRYPLRENTECL